MASLSSDITTLYELGPELGRGEFSTVVLGTDKKTKEKVAIKIIEKNEMDTSRLETEVMILKKVQHPNIIELKGFYDTTTKLYLIMELVTGGELFNRIVELGAYSEATAISVVKKLLDAVAYLHSQNIVHRDLKPTNLLLKSVDDDSDVKIADFGLSKILGENALMQTACGTPIYVAPEVLAGESYDREVDLWSIGVIMYILLCGFPPFFNDGTNVAMLFDQIMSGKFDFPDPYWTDISDDAKDLINKLLTVEPKDRPTAEEALKHPWIKGGGSSKKLDVQAKLKEFNSRRKKKK